MKTKNHKINDILDVAEICNVSHLGKFIRLACKDAIYNIIDDRKIPYKKETFALIANDYEQYMFYNGRTEGIVILHENTFNKKITETYN